jgi:hypothetical protein
MADRGYYLEDKQADMQGVDAYKIAIKQELKDRASWLNQ